MRQHPSTSDGQVTVHVDTAPDVFRLRGTIADRLAGAPTLPGPESAVADAVLRAVEQGGA